MEWISLDIELPPEEVKSYIVYHSTYRNEVAICQWIQKYSKSKGHYWCWNSTPYYPRDYITHWMKIPSIPSLSQ